MVNIRITSKGIKKTLQKFDYLQAIAEYIWNGFDAKATIVEIKAERNALGGLERLMISDNGEGIDRTVLERKFTPFYESEKQIDAANRVRMSSTMHGKNGIGRLTFHSFCSRATWTTTYHAGAGNQTYSIHIASESLDAYTLTDNAESKAKTGTTVTFDYIHKEIDLFELKQFLSKEFGWFLELHEGKKFGIVMETGDFLDYSGIIGAKETMELEHPPTQTKFAIKYIRWTERINNEYSKLYFLDARKREKHKQPTSFNNKGDSFYHSVYIQSKLFDDFDFMSDEQYGQQEMTFGLSRKSEVFQYLLEHINQLISGKRKPFLKIHSDLIISDLVASDAFPAFKDTPEDGIRQEELKQVIQELYRIEPRIFARLNPEQKKVIVHLLNLLMETADRGRLYQVLNGMLPLEGPERQEMAALLHANVRRQ
ncbi:ATP-binding protein [Paenibacillus glycinis]|uniref:ATP-binding protein n=1 Tax=Paenibacillus glycinis TaxID=2697035 RepID=A0ABW9XNB9_9BACL|nr:ATP-binding protein [Paenibacillus glycinis]NBD24121.1 hypothetical protein [Paenibacillus glycinis]